MESLTYAVEVMNGKSSMRIRLLLAEKMGIKWSQFDVSIGRVCIGEDTFADSIVIRFQSTETLASIKRLLRNFNALIARGA